MMLDDIDITIRDTNAARIEAALDSVNGLARTHTFTTYTEIAALVPLAEDALTEALLPKTLWSDALFVQSSGGRLPNAYKGRPINTVVTIARVSTRWVVRQIGRGSLSPGSAVKSGNLVLSPRQSDEAVKRFRSSRFLTRLQTFAEFQAANANGVLLPVGVPGLTREQMFWLDQECGAHGWREVEIYGGRTAINFTEHRHGVAFKIRWI